MRSHKSIVAGFKLWQSTRGESNQHPLRNDWQVQPWGDERWEYQLFVFDKFYSWTGSNQLNGIFWKCLTFTISLSGFFPDGSGVVWGIYNYACFRHCATYLLYSCLSPPGVVIIHLLYDTPVLSYKAWSFSSFKINLFLWLSPDFWLPALHAYSLLSRVESCSVAHLVEPKA